MKTLYLECGMGAAGDMLTAALLELMPDRQAVIDRLNALNLPGIHYEMESAVKCGICGTHMKVTVNGYEEESLDVHEHAHGHMHAHEHHHEEEHAYEHRHEDAHMHDHEHLHEEEHTHEHYHDEMHTHPHEHGHMHHHSSLADITAQIEHLNIPECVRKDAVAVYRIIAEAEGKVHGMSMDAIHFHEVGTMDAVADVAAVCFLMHEIGAEQIIASPVHVGSGYVKCMHGVLPVPAPATALILEGIPTYGGAIEGELCTPTGAALLRHFATRFGDRPVMSVKAIGYGMGKKDFPRANCVRAFLGDTEEHQEETIVRLECNLDDMSGEAVGFAMEQLFEAGARDVYWQHIGMKKSRPGILLSVIAMPEDADRMAELLFRHTTTLGVRRENLTRYVLEREVKPVETDAGTVRIKTASGYGSSKAKLEYEDIARLARERNVGLETVLAEIRNYPV